MSPRYLLCPGYVISRHDGDKHYIGPGALAKLYGVDLRECVVLGRGQKPGRALIPLRPRENGDYTLPAAGCGGGGGGGCALVFWPVQQPVAFLQVRHDHAGYGY